MARPLAKRDVGPVSAAPISAFVALAIFAWTERTELVDPDGPSAAY